MSNRPGRILFVDDERSVLNGLQAILRRTGQRWDAAFAIGGAEALETLEREAFDVVVTDLEMPYVDGVAVLKHTLATNPEAIRIVLSNGSSEDQALRAGLHAHQSLAKPCEPKELETTLRRAFEIRATVTDPEMRAMLGGLRDLPAIPRTYQRLVSVLEDPRSSMADVSRIIEGDIAATAKILHLVNSAFFGFGRPVRTMISLRAWCSPPEPTLQLHPMWREPAKSCRSTRSRRPISRRASPRQRSGATASPRVSCTRSSPAPLPSPRTFDGPSAR
jgi:CheY-like chemotaxis protein